MVALGGAFLTQGKNSGANAGFFVLDAPPFLGHYVALAALVNWLGCSHVVTLCAHTSLMAYQHGRNTFPGIHSAA